MKNKITTILRKREPLMYQKYFNRAIVYDGETIGRFETKLAGSTSPAANRARLAYSIFRKRLELLLMRYSSGEDVSGIESDFPLVIESLERYRQIDGHHDMAIDRSLDDYVLALWLVSLALIFKVDTVLFDRLVKCIENTRKDRLLERLIATRISHRSMANHLMWPKQYQVLSEAIDGQIETRSGLFERFLKGWYASMRDTYWYENHKGPNGGGFFGYWCIEAAGVVSAFGFDDAPFSDMPYYPKDILLHSRTKARKA